MITIQCLLIDAWFVPRLPNAYQICCTIKLHQYSNGIEPSDDLFVLLAVRPSSLVKRYYNNTFMQDILTLFSLDWWPLNWREGVHSFKVFEDSDAVTLMM